MRGKAVLDGFKNYFLALLSVIVFPVAWVRSFRLARRHADTDPRGVQKVAVGIALGVLLVAGAAFYAVSFQEDSVDGIYGSLDGRLSMALGNDKWQAATDEGRTADAEALAGNHALYTSVSDAVAAHDDDKARQLIATRDINSLDESLVKPADVDKAFAIKDKATQDLDDMMGVFVYPGLVGTFFAPLVWAVGSILRTSWEPSETVGFKPYPHKSAGLILLLGAFGVPATLYAAWVLLDLESRSAEGQIAL